MPSDPASFSLRGKVIIQFGGTGLLGRALVHSLAEAEATLIVASRSRKSMDSIIAPDRATGCFIDVDEVDITVESSITALRDRVLAAHGRVDGIVFNAVTRPMRSNDGSLDEWASSMAVNATSYFATIRAFGDAMAHQRRGSIVSISSMYGMVGSNLYLYEGTPTTVPPDYFFHKAGMINVTRYWASHYGPSGVRANVISPGGIYNPETPQTPAFLERYAKMTPLGRMAEAPEIGGAVVFLLSDAATYITGANLPVDGGYTAR
jgi:NAD(P)-dependent dehydrogenase (short-subunit alcohol dehydrogenase family)